jgi:hypothetical protein
MRILVLLVLACLGCAERGLPIASAPAQGDVNDASESLDFAHRLVDLSVPSEPASSDLATPAADASMPPPGFDLAGPDNPYPNCPPGSNPCHMMCVDHLLDPNNCGFCGFACAADQVCHLGHCK